MKYLKISLSILTLALTLVSCKQHEEARKPISQTSGSFMKQSAERNKKLVATEEDQIKKIIKDNPNIEYIPSKKGYWYYYDIQNSTDTLTPKRGDVAFFTYEIKNLKGDIIYSELELRPQTYHVDKQEILMGLRDGIKLMHKNEKVNFLFPSHIAYGYHGDNKKIGTNIPIMVTVTLTNFISEAMYNKYTGAKKVTAPTDTVTLSAQDSAPSAPKAVPQKDTIN